MLDIVVVYSFLLLFSISFYEYSVIFNFILMMDVLVIYFCIQITRNLQPTCPLKEQRLSYTVSEDQEPGSDAAGGL